MKGSDGNWQHRVFDSRWGIIHDVVELQVDAGAPHVHCCVARLPDLRSWTGFPFTERGSGAGRTRQEAVTSALAEAIERYASAVSFLEAETVVASPGALGSEAVALSELVAYAPQQYQGDLPFPTVNPDAPLRWVKGYSLTRQMPLWVPSQFVYLPYLPSPGEPVYSEQISTGTACGQTLNAALQSALCEIVERDAFMIHWLNRLPAPRIKWETDLEMHAELSKRYVRPGLTYHLFDITTDIGVPSVLAFVLDEQSEHAAIAVGAASHPDPRRAAVKAVMESVQTRAWLRQMVKLDGRFQLDHESGIQNFDDHVRLWGARAMLPRLGFLMDQHNSVPIRTTDATGDVGADVSRIIQQLARQGLEAVMIDITPADIRSLGLTVVKVVIPGAVPLHANHRCRPLGAARLRSVPSFLGYTVSSAVQEFNTDPHPFP